MKKQEKMEAVKAWLMFASLAAVLILTNVICMYL